MQGEHLSATPRPKAEIHRITKWVIISNEGSQPVVQKSFSTGQSLLLCWPRLSTLDNQLRSLPRSLLRMGIVRSRSTFLVTFTESCLRIKVRTISPSPSRPGGPSVHFSPASLGATKSVAAILAECGQSET